MNSNQYVNNKSDNERRISRMETWIDLAKNQPTHLSFILHWIAYEAASGVYKDDGRYHGSLEREQFHLYITRRNPNIKCKLKSISRDIHYLLDLRQSDDKFWHKRNQRESSEKAWNEQFRERARESRNRLENGIETVFILNDLFSNLNVVRNQIAHGGSSGVESFGKKQVKLGERILRKLVPEFHKTIKSNMNEDSNTFTVSNRSESTSETSTQLAGYFALSIHFPILASYSKPSWGSLGNFPTRERHCPRSLRP